MTSADYYRVNFQMAKRMQYSVLGLPHYTIWHLYEPSSDDLRHMEQMEEERKKLAEEAESTKAKQDLLTSQFDVESGKSQWEKDKEALRLAALKGEETKVEKTAGTKDIDTGNKLAGKQDGTADKSAPKAFDNQAARNMGKAAGDQSPPPAPPAVAANQPFGDMLTNTQDRLKKKQQQYQQQQAGSPGPAGNRPAPQPVPDAAAAVAAGNNMAQKHDGSGARKEEGL
jgi:mannan polymerase II complex ANP1 subunit